MAKRKAFGISKNLDEGISQTINAVKNNAGQLRYEVVPLSKIQFDPENPRKLAIQIEELTKNSSLMATDPLFERKRKDLESLQSLANSIKKTGVRHAVEVYKDGINYRLISGERRVLGSILAGKEDIQARVLDSKPSEFDIRYLQWIENIEREDLTIWERVHNVKQLINAYSQTTGTDVSATSLKDILGCSLPHAMTFLSILQAPPDIQALIESNSLTNLEKVAFLAKITDTPLRERLITACLEENYSLAMLKKHASENLKISREIKKVSHSLKSRVAKRVVLGSTSNISVAKELITMVLTHTKYQAIATEIPPIDWQDCSSVSRAFQVLIKILEKEFI